MFWDTAQIVASMTNHPLVQPISQRSAAVHIPDVFVKPVYPRPPKYSIMFCSNQGGKEKNRYGKSSFIVLREEIRPSCECVPGTQDTAEL